ncbi:hypothetical protein ACOZ4F_10930 [Haloarcula marismortui]|uniref:hypothetical protein n=1 Tax=Haloarcula marismortui TaxID=2238 RepID=UPI003C7928A7
MSHGRSILLAGLLVLSAVVSGAGPALAQSTDTGPVRYEFTGSPDTLIVDTSNLDGGTEFTVEYTTQGGPSTGTTVLARRTYNTANLDQDQLLFFNDGAYESVNVTVSGYSGGEPTFDSNTGILGGVNLVRTVVGTTGGDSDLTCDTSDQVGSMLSGVTYLDCTSQPGSTTINTTNTDAQQTQLDLYTSGQNQRAQTQNYYNTVDNTLADAKTQARVVGKNAYLRALNNGSSKSAAKTEAKNAVRDWYAVRENNLLANYEAQMAHWQYMHSVAGSETGLEDSTQAGENHNATVDVLIERKEKGNGRAGWRGTKQLSYQLVNGTTTTVTYNEIRLEADYSGAEEGSISLLGPTNNTVSYGGTDVVAGGLQVNGTSSGDPLYVYWDADDTNSRLTEIQQQKDTVVSEMDTLAENTYSAYQQGEINNSDLVDPYVLASQQSPGSDFQGWAAAQLTLLGTNSPENFDQIGSFNITTGDGTQYEGVLFSQENPASGQFENGTTYDTANIGGTQYVVTSDQIVELSGTFTINQITTTSGETTQNVTIQKTTYETTNVTELKQQYEELARRRAEIEAREQNLQGAAGGGLLGSSSSSLVIGLVAVAALYAVSQRRSGGKY